MRNGFLKLADEEPEKWLVIDNARSTIEESLQRIFNKVKTILEAKGWDPIPDPKFAELDAIEEAATPRSKLAAQVASLLDIPDREERQQKAMQVFMKNLHGFIPQQSSHAAFYITGLDTSEANAIREEIIESDAALVAYGLRGLRSEAAMSFRDRLKDLEPFYVARSLAGMAEDPNAIRMRNELAEAAPEQLARSSFSRR